MSQRCRVTRWFAPDRESSRVRFVIVYLFVYRLSFIERAIAECIKIEAKSNSLMLPVTYGNDESQD